jgi:hypothetical protein
MFPASVLMGYGCKYDKADSGGNYAPCPVSREKKKADNAFLRKAPIWNCLGKNFVGELPGNRRAILGISPTNDRPKWFKSDLGYFSHK